jgi:hypothetical protein
LLAKASDQSTSLLLTNRFREQARSHSGFVLGADFVSNQSNVGAGLAREEALSANRNDMANTQTGCPRSILLLKIIEVVVFSTPFTLPI